MLFYNKVYVLVVIQYLVALSGITTPENMTERVILQLILVY